MILGDLPIGAPPRERNTGRADIWSPRWLERPQWSTSLVQTVFPHAGLSSVIHIRILYIHINLYSYQYMCIYIYMCVYTHVHITIYIIYNYIYIYSHNMCMWLHICVDRLRFVKPWGVFLTCAALGLVAAPNGTHQLWVVAERLSWRRWCGSSVPFKAALDIRSRQGCVASEKPWLMLHQSFWCAGANGIWSSHNEENFGNLHVMAGVHTCECRIRCIYNHIYIYT